MLKSYFDITFIIFLGMVQSLTQFMVQWLHGNCSSEYFAKTTYMELDGTPTRDLFTILNQRMYAQLSHDC